LPDAFPQRAARRRIDGDHTRIGLTADGDDEPVSFENRRRADAEESVRDGHLRQQVALPHNLARIKLETQQPSLCAERIAVRFGQNGTAARAVVVSVRVLERARIGVRPQQFAGVGPQAVDNLLASLPVMHHQTPAAHRRRAVAGPDALLPDQRQPGLGPRLDQSGFGRCAVVSRTQEPRPVLAVAK